MDKGINNSINVSGVNNQAQTAKTEQQPRSEKEKIVIDFKGFDSDGDLHVTVDEVLQHQIDVYNRTGELPAGKTIAEFLMDIQQAVEKHAGDDKQLNVDEYADVVRSGVEMSRPSEEAKESHGVYSEWMEVNDKGNVSYGAEYSPRAKANQKQIDEITEMKKQSEAKTVEDKEKKSYRVDDEKAKNTRNEITELQKQLALPNTPEGHAEIKKEIAFLQSVLESQGFEP